MSNALASAHFPALMRAILREPQVRNRNRSSCRFASASLALRLRHCGARCGVSTDRGSRAWIRSRTPIDGYRDRVERGPGDGSAARCRRRVLTYAGTDGVDGEGDDPGACHVVAGLDEPRTSLLLHLGQGPCGEALDDVRSNKPTKRSSDQAIKRSSRMRSSLPETSDSTGPIRARPKSGRAGTQRQRGSRIRSMRRRLRVVSATTWLRLRQPSRRAWSPCSSG